MLTQCYNSNAVVVAIVCFSELISSEIEKSKQNPDKTNSMTETIFFTSSPVSTEPQTASGWFGQLVNIESSTVSYPDVLRPLTAAGGPMETHLARDNALCHCRMPASQITWRMRTTIVFSNTAIWHLISRKSCEPIPGLRKRAVTFDASSVALRTIGLIQGSVASTLYSRETSDHCKYIFFHIYESNYTSFIKRVLLVRTYKVSLPKKTVVDDKVVTLVFFSLLLPSTLKTSLKFGSSSAEGHLQRIKRD